MIFFSEKSSANFSLAFDAYALELQNILEERCEVSQQLQCESWVWGSACQYLIKTNNSRLHFLVKPVFFKKTIEIWTVLQLLHCWVGNLKGNLF